MRHLSAFVAAVVCAAGLVVVGSAPAHAACDWSTYYKTFVRKAGLVHAFKSPSDYNSTKDNVTLTFTSSTTRTYSNTASWEVGVEAGMDIKMVKAKVSGKYGRSSTQGLATTKSVSKTITIRPKHSGWSQLNLRRRVYVVEKRRIAPYCGDQLMVRVAYRDWYYNGSSHTKLGRVSW